MSLEKWVEYGWLRREPTSPGEIKDLLGIVERSLAANPKLIQRFKTFNNKRNKSVYDVAGAVSDQELAAMVKLAVELKDATVAWLQKFHPELLKK
jgi:hypothetical protein